MHFVIYAIEFTEFYLIVISQKLRHDFKPWSWQVTIFPEPRIASEEDSCHCRTGITQLRILMELRRTPEAIEVAEKAIYFSPSNLEMRLKVSELYLQRGLGDSALPHLLYATKIKENDFGAYQMLTKYYISKKDKVSATEYAQKILHYYPELTESVVRDLFRQINSIP